MAPDPKVIAAFQAMKALGISQVKVKPVLKNLLRLYEKNWSLIQEDNYRALADAIFEAEETATEEKKKRENGVNKDLLEEEEEPGPEPERPLKRLRLRGREVNQSPELSNSRPEASQVSPQNMMRNKGKEPMVAEKSLVPFSPNHGVHLKEPMADSGRIVSRDSVTDTHHMLIEPKDEPYTDDMCGNNIPQYEVPIAVIHPDPVSKKKLSAVENSNSRKEIDPMCEKDIRMESGETRTGVVKESAFQFGGESRFGSLSLETNTDEAPDKDGSTSDLNVATSPSGEVKLFLRCNSAVGKHKFRMPTLDAVIKMTEEKCLRSFKITDPKFSVVKLLSGVCESFLELGTDAINEPQGLPNGTDHVPSDLDGTQVCEKTLENALGGGGSGENQILNGDGVHTSKTTLDGTSTVDKDGESEDPKSANMWEMVVVPLSECASDELRSLDDVKDITRGEEWVQIPWTNEKSYECPPAFRYISQGVVFQNAKLDISLSRIGATSCCPTCSGDCLSASVPCACAQETGGQFAYTTEGVVKEGFLEECISLMRNTQRQSMIFCEECPLERSKNEDCSEPCKGHLKRKFIKECWAKCGCSKKCGNRVVQRGITRNLQVFFTADERGWGLRTLEELPKGMFVCEYVGEILTTTESREREMKCDKSSKETYLALLDADWGSKETLSDDKALCLDGSQFGNVSRFINHRCLDANLVEIPVEVETPDHHYYHVAFFTTRKVNALEELTWDYGIDFDDFDHPIKPFLCLCGSKFCRNIKRQNRSKSTPIAS